MDNKILFEKYSRSWRFMEVGSKQAKNDLAGVRRTRTSLQRMLTSDFEQVLQPEHVLALRAAASVLAELDSTLDRLPRLLDSEQKRRQREYDEERVAEINVYIAGRAEDEPFKSDAAAQEELALLDTFNGFEGQEWLMAAKGVVGASSGVETVYSSDRAFSAPRFKSSGLTARQNLALRLSRIAAAGKISEYRGGGIHVSWGLKEFCEWKTWRDQVQTAITKAIANAEPST